jgi:hypothetical protein
MKAALLDLLEVRRGRFRYESGYHGEIWLNLDRLFAAARSTFDSNDLDREEAAEQSRRFASKMVLIEFE